MADKKQNMTPENLDKFIKVLTKPHKSEKDHIELIALYEILGIDQTVKESEGVLKDFFESNKVWETDYGVDVKLLVPPLFDVDIEKYRQSNPEHYEACLQKKIKKLKLTKTDLGLKSNELVGDEDFLIHLEPNEVTKKITIVPHKG